MDIKTKIIKDLFRINHLGKVQPNNSKFRSNCITKYIEENAALIEEIVKAVSSVFDTVSRQFDIPTMIKIFAQDNNYIPHCKTCNSILNLNYQNGWKTYCGKKCAQNDPEVKSRIAEGQSLIDWDKVVEKRKSTCMARYNVEAPSQLPHVKEKIASASRLYYSDHDNVNIANSKREETNIQLYGVLYRSMDPEFHAARVEKAKVTKSKKSVEEKRASTDKGRCTRLGPEKFAKLSDPEWCRVRYEVEKKTIAQLARELQCSPDSIRYGLARADIEIDHARENQNRSVTEIEMFEFIKTLAADAKHSIRINQKEMDVLIPSLNLGIEFNGVYWHSEAVVDKKYHQRKLNHFNSLGYRLIQIWEDDWETNQTAVKNFLSNLISKTEKIGARKTEVVQISQKEANQFLSINHLQGAVNAKYRFALKYNGEIKAVMCFKPAASNTKHNGTMMLTRFANTNISGAFGKLLSAFIKQCSPNTIRTFADLETVDASENVYVRNGFIEVGRLHPDYTYYNYRTKVREYKAKWRKPTFCKTRI